ncbi:polysaccharide pyruvyl transferase family protein [Anaerosinus gibii]|uniref:Polysaccharide pyruvyl transferase family protein n=1 Tax=Selenobaculum gibii TaxID=3054208 RepID=A0A9Y2AJP2_9FIRM|nr:polysaccharide pyruvyl transferase family protein [Selenobaculum gbiensis]WIW71091.1 polysaccharide pyruvyl transferase family protein [Selenobaculum gbiensis]
MKICVLGWYGTETIGDRAILAGIISLINQKNNEYKIYLGSLYPFYSKRMLKEDYKLYELLLNRKLEIELFNSKDICELELKIEASDVVMIAGGPLMDLPELHMLKYAFRYAHKKNKKNIIFGCGIGPLFCEEFRQCVLDITKMADVIILRDTISKRNLLDISQKYNYNIDITKIFVSFDPAVECAWKYKINNSYSKNAKKNTIVVNLREFPMEYSKDKSIKDQVNKRIINFLYEIVQNNRDKSILLLPMHYFFIGNDDRYYLNYLLQTHMKNYKNIFVQNKPLSLVETMDKFIDADYAIGMRFHSIVLETILNGNNYILDYTEFKKGKISGFIDDCDKNGFYNERYVCLQNEFSKIDLRFSKNVFEMSDSYYLSNRRIYMKAMSSIF